MTQPVPDATREITQGQAYLHDGAIDPFGFLLRLKQHVIGKFFPPPGTRQPMPRLTVSKDRWRSRS
ncbi:hypothetical protein CLG85_000805 [Yangia mangrovi]|uniref:Uncharacterized protein n=1 Tax=Alloyangia mangrovi TaxID=1779329 RepID=A0ABT2KF14_9RHOB|nr:hypothetical protein [Alloyangia mangrovi]